MINLISGVSVFGITVITAALVIVLSAFNGIESLVIQLFSTFEPDIKIESAKTKTFEYNFIPEATYQVDGLTAHSKVIEEIVIIKNEDMFIIGTMKGVEPVFLKMVDMSAHLLDGRNEITVNGSPTALIGASALENLGGLIYGSDLPPEIFTIYAPNRNEKISRRNVDAFTTSSIPVTGVFSFNNEIDREHLVVPLSYANEVLDYDSEITAVEMKFEEGTDLEAKKAEILSIVGSDFSVKTNLEHNQLIYQTNKSEKWIVTLILAFIFFLATFNMIACITMLVIEKRANMQTLYAMGAKKEQLHHIFFFEGLLINFLGLLFGLILGYGICLLQQQVGLIRMEGSVVEYFPIYFKLQDFLAIIGITSIFGLLAAYVPSKILINRIIT